MQTDNSCANAVQMTALNALLCHTSDLIFIKDCNSVYLNASETFVRMTGQPSLDYIVGHTDFEIFENQELARRYVDDDSKLLLEGNDLINYVEPITDDHGHSRYSMTSKYILRNEAGDAIGILGISRDITKEYITQQRYQQELRYLFELPEDTYAVLFLDIDAWRIIRHRRQKNGPYVLAERATMEEFTENALNCLADPTDEKTRTFYQNLSRESMMALSSQGLRYHGLKYLRRMPNGDAVWVQIDINFLVDPETGHLCAIWVMKNIDNVVQDALNLRYAAECDEMTGLLNRASTMKKIEQILDETPDRMHALLALDIDCFKLLNDRMGHQAGDEFLIEFAKILKGCFRGSDVVGRVGGDEFFVLMRNAPNDKAVVEKAEAVMGASRQLCGKYPVKELGVSMGISLFPVDGVTVSALYTKADEALYRAKRSGKNRYCFADKPEV